jgi:transcriptional regulator GlxA family with amidase domain
VRGGEARERAPLPRTVENALGEIAGAGGYSTTDGMRLAFDRNLGATPREYRLRFC